MYHYDRIQVLSFLIALRDLIITRLLYPALSPNYHYVKSGVPGKSPSHSRGVKLVFAERQVVHFAMVLGRKWVCTEPGHEICYTGQGKHVPLTDDMIMTWVTALCNGEATTHLPPFDLREEFSGSDSDAQFQPDPIQQSNLTKSDINTNKAINPGAHSGQKTSSLRKYPSSSRISTISSFSQNSTSSWHSAGTGTGMGMGMGTYTSSSTTSTSEGPITPATTASFPYASLRRVNSDKSIDHVSFSETSRPVPHLPSPPPLSPLSPPFSALPSPPLQPPPLSNTVGVRPDIFAHPVISESLDRPNITLRSPPQGKEQTRVSTQPFQPQSHSSHHASVHSVPPTNHILSRSPHHQRRTQSPESAPNIKHSHISSRTPPQQHVHNLVSAPVVSRAPRSHSQPYTSVSHSQNHVSYAYPPHTTHLSHVREEEEAQSFQPEWASSGRDQDRKHQRKFIGDRDRDGADADIEGDHHYLDPDADPDDDAETHSLGRTDEYEFDRQDVGSGGGANAAGGERTTSRNARRDAHNGEFDHESIGGSEAGGGGGRSIWSPYTSFLPSINTTAPPGAGNGPTPSLSSTVKSKWIESATLAKRAKSHLSRIKKWRKRAITTVIEGRYTKRGKEGAQVGTVERNLVIEMIGDGVEMARSCYPPRIHKLGYELGKEVQQWLQTFTDNDPVVLYKKENVSLLTTVQTCFLPILLMRIAEIEPPAITLANNLIAALTKIPLSLHENELQATNGSNVSPLFTSLPSNQKNRVRRESESKSLPSSSSHNSMIPVIPHRNTSVSSIAIHMVAHELGSPAPICPTQHSWLGMTLLKIVEMTMKLRFISFGEIEDIRTVGRKREEEYASQSGSYPTLIDARFTRPWEVALFALCASTETPVAPFFRRMVLGPTGIPLLVLSLNSLMASNIDMDDVKWEDVGLVLRALAFVSEHGWVVQGMSGDDDETEGEDKVVKVVKSIMNVFWRSIPERWFSIRFWAMDAVRNIVSHRPPLVRLLAEIKADKAFITLTPSSPLYPVAINTSRISVEGGGKIRNRLLEEYRKESAKRAEEMVDYIRMWHNATISEHNGKTHGGFRNTVVLQPVAIGFDGR
ncbi:hypothetical protein Clacol_008428 [Clathrus columnatus]|uniref:Uncharacterized protein n=1 Tax=Clathrus columnatus TaxID=1419009 RepID=A0AAV5AK88_9AGAM|nr:hypothetical protein Clacol_008428 [Clathrus columnatus]